MSKTKGKKILSLVLTLCMVLSLLPTMAFAAEDPTVAEVNSLQGLETAIATDSANTIKLTGNIENVTSTIKISRSLTLDLNGNTISGSVTPTTGVVQATAGDVTIKGPGNIQNTSTTTNYQPGIIPMTNGSIVVVNATGTSLSSAANLTLDGGVSLKSSSPSTDNNAGIVHAGTYGTVTINDATIEGTEKHTYPAFLASGSGAKVIVNGGEFKGIDIALEPYSSYTMLAGRFKFDCVASGKSLAVKTSGWTGTGVIADVKVVDSAPTDYIASREISGKTVYVTKGDIGVLTALHTSDAVNTTINVLKDATIHTTLGTDSKISFTNTLKFNIAAGATVSGEIKVPQYGRVEYSGGGSIADIVKASTGYQKTMSSGATDVVAENVAVMVYDGNTLVNNYTADNAAEAFNSSNLSKVSTPVIKVIADVTINDAIKVIKDITVDIAKDKTLTATFHSFDSHTLTLDGEGTLKAKDGTNDLAIACGLTESSTGSGTPATFDSTHHGSAVIGKDVTVEGAVAVFNEGSKLDVYGTVTTSGLAISGNGGTNGDENHGGTEIVIHKSATVKSTGSAAIYHPQVGTLTIGCDDADCANADVDGANTGAVITGKIAVAARAGTVMVKGGTITSNSDSAISVNGIQLYPAGIVADMNEGYSKGSLSITVTGGRIIAEGTHKAVTGSTGGNEQTGTAEDKIIVSGGEFSSQIDTVYLPAGKECKKVESAQYYTIEDAAEQPAKVVTVSETTDGKTDQQYASLADAIKMAKPGATITVLDNVTDGKITLDKTVTVTKDVTIDLNGKTIEATNVAAFTVTGSKLTLDSKVAGGKVTSSAATTVRVEENAVGVVVNKNVSVEGQNGLFAAANIKNDVTFDVNGTVIGTNAAIITNGNITAHTVNININDGAKVTNEQATAIYAAGKSNITVKGGTITGKDAGIEIRSGSLTVIGGTIKATDAADTSTATSATVSGSGATVKGAAVAVSPHAGKTVDVTISGGTIEGPSGLYFADTVTGDNETITAEITGGTFKATNENGKSVGQSTGVATGTLDGIITGGTYTNNANEADAVGEYMDTNVILTSNGEVAQDTALSDRVFPAVLADKADDEAVSKDPKILSKTTNTDDHYLEVKLSIDQLQQHTPNDTQQTTKAYWFGIAVKAPEGAKAVKTAIVKNANKPTEFSLKADTIAKIDKEGKVEGVAAYIGYQSIPETLDTFWIEVQWLDDTQNGKVITTDLIKLVPTITFVPDGMTPFEIVEVGFGADPDKVTNAIKAAAKKAYATWDWPENDVAPNTVYVVYKGGKDDQNGATVTLKITNGDKTYTETSTGAKHAGSFYATLNDQLKNLGAGNYTITLTVDGGVVATDNTLKIYKIVYKANGGTFTAADKDAAEKAFGDATSTEISFFSTDNTATLAGLAPTNGEKVLTWGDAETSEDGYTITYTAEWTEKSAPTPPSSTGGGGGVGSSATVNSSKAINGSFAISDKNAKAGDTVKITPKANDGYVVDQVTVTDKNGNNITVTQNADGTYSFVMPEKSAQPVDVKVTFKLDDAEKDCPSEKFTDVDQDKWYHEGVDYAIKNGLMNGTGADTFAPDATTTRAMVVTILYRLDGEPAVTKDIPFADVPAGQWYSNAINWAAANGIVDGYGNGKFGPDDTITREQMAAILYRYASYKGYSVSDLANLTGYTDAASVSEWASTAMRWAVAEGLIEGTSATTLSPSGDSTRAEVATILMRFCEGVVK